MSPPGSRPSNPLRRLDTVVTRLLLLAGVPLCAVAVAGFITYHGHVRPLVAREALSDLRSTNASATALAEAWIDDQLAMLRFLGDREAAVEWDVPRMLVGARRFARSFEQINAVVYADRDGDAVVDSVRGSGGNVASRSYFRSALAGEPVVASLPRIRTSGLPSFIVAQPVFDATGSTAGVVFATVEPERVAEVLAAGAGATEVVSFVVDQDGTIATGPALGTAVDDDHLPARRADEPYTNARGVSVYGVSSRIERTGWTVVSEVPAASVTTTLDRYNRVLVGALLVTVAVAAAMAILVGLSIQVPVAHLGRLASLGDNPPASGLGAVRTMKRAPVELRRVYERMLAMMDTIAERQRELARSNEILEAAQDIADVGSWEYDPQTGLITCSRELLRIGGAPELDPVMHRSELLGLVHPDEREQVVDRFDRTLEANEPGFELEHRVRVLATGEDRYVLHRVVHVRDESGRPVRSLGIVMDITARHAIEESLRLALEEKSVLLQEVHHRVRNNLAVVESVLSLQRLQLPEGSRAHRVLADAQSRITSMALLHRYLYRSENLAEVHLGEYIRTVLENVEASYGSPEIELRESLEDVVVDVATAVPCGLILNELVVNAYKHAFPDGRGAIDVRIEHVDGDAVAITVTDDGVGTPADTRAGESGGLGSQLAGRLADQISATLGVETGDGTRTTLRFRPS